jgi:hypothetical protein
VHIIFRVKAYKKWKRHEDSRKKWKLRVFSAESINISGSCFGVFLFLFSDIETMEDQVREELTLLSRQQILSLSHGQVIVPTRIRSHSDKNAIIDYVVERSSPSFIELLRSAALSKKERLDQGSKDRVAGRKRKRVTDQTSRRVKAKAEISNLYGNRTFSKFMELPSKEQVHRCYREFYNATSNKALEMAVCAVCAREISNVANNITTMDIEEIPNSQLLTPKTPHPAHRLIRGLLLEPSGVIDNADGSIFIKICRGCKNDLQTRTRNPPRFSLANNMWIGPVPWELERLSFPEQLLVALLYPRVFVFKLYTKNTFQPDSSSLQRGMRGTVSTYDLDVGAAAEMVQGRLMPRPMSVLSSVISVTFIGQGRLSIRKIHNIFRVRRQVVLEALVWLKENNPKYYGDIIIDHGQLRQLPEDDVPIEISSIIRQSEDVGVIELEHNGYIPEHVEESRGKFFFFKYAYEKNLTFLPL